ncbi:MAG: NlpC/P60 family protein [Bacteroidales bacterium]
MQFAISALPVIPLRSEPSEKAEMINQLLFGEYVIIHEKQQSWSYVEFGHDNYKGWLSTMMLHHIDSDMASELIQHKPRIPGNIFLPVVNNQNKNVFYIPAGSSLYHYKPASNVFRLADLVFTCHSEPVFYPEDKIRDNISMAAIKFLNIPYLWGGKNPFGIDCSGLVQVIMKLFGKNLPRDARQQVTVGRTVNFISEARPGDLAFFDNEEGQIIHTGIITDHQQIVHASGSVKLDKIDHQGIYSSTLKQYTHRLRVIKNVLD